MKNLLFMLLLPLLASVQIINAQNKTLYVPTPGDYFPEFTLPIYQGGEFSVKQQIGKNILFIALRGKYADDHWCAICNYQYSDFAFLDAVDSIRYKYNLEIVFLMPYSFEQLTIWEKAFPSEIMKIENWKYPQDSSRLTPEQVEWSEYTRKKFPKSFTFPDGKADLRFPVLCDANRDVSKGLDIFRNEWDGGKTAQNIPAVYIIDTKGILRFKYISQNTFDRLPSSYIISFIESTLQPENE
jgi:peroxiredoxin